MRHESQADTTTATPALAPTVDASEEASRVIDGVGLARGDMVGRYTILSTLGRGGMGIVFAAYDPELNRKVAIKLLLGGADAVAQSQILREAQALARLSHPNVVTIYDVGVWRGYIWLAMEFIDGGTLRSWLTNESRHWREILQIFQAAGSGLEAAHGAGLVHRDFKPENVMIGNNGRVYVTDFGLARLDDNKLPEAIELDELVRNSTPKRSPELTTAGTLKGTPAYMAPEQWRRTGSNAQTDQFSFSVALYEALYGVRPFVGDWATLMMQVERGMIPPPPPDSPVPRRVFKIVARGLATAPEQRWPRLDSLLAALARDPRRAQLRILVAIGLLSTASAGSYAIAVSRAPEQDPCTGGKAQISETWGEDRRSSTGQTFAAAGQVYAEEIWPRVVGELDDYAARWSATHRASCEAHRRGEQSSEMLDRSMVCLGQRRGALAEAVRVLGEADREVAVRALAVVGDLPAIERCGDVVALAGDEPPPTDLQLRAGVEEQHPQLARVRMLERAGRVASATELADRVVEAAEALGDRALLAEALLQRGYLAIHGGMDAQQDARLTRAYLTALGGGLDELAAEALALRLYVRGRSEDGGREALADLAVAQETLTRLTSRGASPGRVRGLVLNNAGTMYLALGDTAKAEKMFREALAVRSSALGAQHVEVAYTLVNLALVTGAPEEQAALLRQALEIFDRELGVAHPQTIEVRIVASLHVVDPTQARALLAPGCAALDRFAEDDHEYRARCLGHLAHHADEAGDPAATAMWLTVDELLRTAGPLRMNAADAAQLRGRAALATRAHALAIDMLVAALGQANGGEWWQQRPRAELALLLGQHRQRLGQLTAARASLRAAVDGYSGVAASDVMLQQRLAAARMLLGAARQADGDAADRREGEALISAAEQWYRAAGPAYAWRLTPAASAP